MQTFQRRFIELTVAKQALAFGRFELKSGRISPYFFNAGRFCDGGSLAVLGECYAAAIIASAMTFDFLFGPAYKGIPWWRPLPSPWPSTMAATCPGASIARRPRTTAKAACWWVRPHGARR